MNSEIILDVFELNPPLPMDMALDAMEKLEKGQYIKMIHRMEPHPLYNILFDEGYKYRVNMIDDQFIIYIWKAVDKTADKIVKNILSH